MHICSYQFKMYFEQEFKISFLYQIVCFVAEGPILQLKYKHTNLKMCYVFTLPLLLET